MDEYNKEYIASFQQAQKTNSKIVFVCSSIPAPQSLKKRLISEILADLDVKLTSEELRFYDELKYQ